MRWKFTLNPDTDALVISEPMGWDKIVLSLVRDESWHGIFFEYSLPLKFYNDPSDSSKYAFDYLKSIYETYGIEGFAILKVELACGDTGDYESQGEWRLSFPDYEEEMVYGLCTVTMNIEPSNCLMTMKSRIDQQVDLESNTSFGNDQLTDYPALGDTISFPPVTVLQVSTMNSPGASGADDADAGFFPVITQDDTVTGGGSPEVETFIVYGNFSFSTGTGYDMTDDLENLDEITTYFDKPNQLYTDYDEMTADYIFTYGGTYTINLRMNGVFQVFCETVCDNTSCGGGDKFNDVSLEVVLIIGGASYTLHSQTDSGCFDASYLFDAINIDHSASYTVTAGQQMRIYFRMESSGEYDSAGIVYWRTAATIRAKFDLFAQTVFPATSVKSFLVNETGSRILEAITDNCLRLLSDYYGRTDSLPYEAPSATDGKGGLRLFTEGLLIRGETTLGKLTMSFEEFFKNLSAIDNIGIGLEPDSARPGFEVIRAEPMEYFYDDTVVLQLDKIPSLRINPLREEHYSTFKVGYNKYEAEAFYGLDEFNTKREYRTGLSSLRNAKDATADFIASGYAIELTRRVGANSETLQDWRFDNDKFIVCLTREEEALVVEQGNIAFADNFVSPTSIYNYRISPARNALRWLKKILGTYRDPQETTSTIEYMDGTGNVIAEGLMTGLNVEEAGPLVENQLLSDDNMSDPGSALPLYVPETWSFDFPLSFSDYNLIKANPTQTIECRFGQETSFREFFIKQIDYRPNEGMASFVLLPKGLYPIDECCFVVIQKRGTGVDSIGSSALVGADIENLFIFIGGELAKYNDANPVNNEVVSWDSATGYAQISSNVPEGIQITFLHIPPMICDPCILRFEGRGDGTTTIILTGFEGAALSEIFFYYGGNLLKYNDANPVNNEITGWNTATAEITLSFATNANREIRAFGFLTDCQ